MSRGFPAALLVALVLVALLTGCGEQFGDATDATQPSAGGSQQVPGIIELRLAGPRGPVNALELDLTGQQAGVLSTRIEVPETGLVRIEVPRDSYELAVRLTDGDGEVVGLSQAEVNLVDRQVSSVDLATGFPEKARAPAPPSNPAGRLAANPPEHCLDCA